MSRSRVPGLVHTFRLLEADQGRLYPPEHPSTGGLEGRESPEWQYS